MTIGDQVLSSASNVLAVVLVARALSADDFGRFALGYTVLTLTLGLSRSYFGTRVTLAPDDESALRLTGALVVTLAMISPPVVVAVLLISGIASGWASLGILVLVAVITPVVCIQDIVRFGAVAAGRPVVALVSDGLWVLVMALPFLFDLSWSSGRTLTLWGVAALLALVVALVLLREPPHPSGAVAELRRIDRVSTSIALGNIATTAASLCVLLVAAKVLGAASVGSLRGASTSMAPVNVMLAFTGLSLTSTLVRRPRRRDLSFSALTALFLTVLTLAWGAVLLLLPGEVGSAAFGASWPGIRQVLPWTVLEYVSVGVVAGAILGLKARSRARELVSQRVFGGIAMVAGGSFAAVYVGTTTAVAQALAIAAAMWAVLGWVQLWRSRAVGARESAPSTVILRTGQDFS